MCNLNWAEVVILLQKQENGMNTWKAGMRLEALDRKTPTLICVATIGMMTNFLSAQWLYSICCKSKSDLMSYMKLHYTTWLLVWHWFIYSMFSFQIIELFHKHWLLAIFSLVFSYFLYRMLPAGIQYSAAWHYWAWIKVIISRDFYTWHCTLCSWSKKWWSAVDSFWWLDRSLRLLDGSVNQRHSSHRLVWSVWKELSELQTAVAGS